MSKTPQTHESLALALTRWLASIVALCLPISVAAQVSVQGLFFYFKPGEPPVQNVVVQNPSERSLLVGVEIIEIEAPGSDQRKRIPATDIIVSPRRFSLPAGSSRLARILLKAPASERERVFRVSFVPESADDPEEESSKAKKPSMNIKVLTGMGILVFVEPLQPRRGLSTNLEGASAILKNTGNINVYIDNIAVCPRKGEGECKKHPAKRLYAEQQMSIPLQPNHRLSFVRRYGDDSETITLDS